MLLPWSHESTELRRRPWVTLALITVCVVVLVASEQDPAVQQFERTLAEAHDYWQSHPYLEPGELLADHFGDDGARAREEFRADLAAGRVPIPAAAIEAEQRELDALASDANAALERHVWYRFGLVPAAPRLAGVFGHMFLHAGWVHLLANLLFLLLTGPFIEDRWGRSVFLLFYLGAGVSAGMLFALQSPEVTAPLIGASGAIAGAMGAFLVLFATVRIKFAYWLGFFWGTFAAPAWLLLPLWFAGELATARLMDVAGASDGVAYWAHVGGFSFGVLAAGVLRLCGVDAWLVARNADPAVCAAQRSACASTSTSGGASIGKVALAQRPAVPKESPRSSPRQPSHLAAPTLSAPVPASIPAGLDEQDLDLFEPDTVDLSKEEGAWSAGELELDLGAPGSYAADAAELFDTRAFDLSEE